MTLPINRAPFAYWSLTRYTQSDLENFCAEHDENFMLALITFKKEQEVTVSISRNTWKRGEGHFGTIVQFFSQVAQHELGQTLDGSIVVWLEDGNFDYTRRQNKVVPLFAFGREKDDTHTFLMPDPSYLGTEGYKKDIEEQRKIDTTPFDQKTKVIFWRGAATGTAIHLEQWVNCARGILALKSLEVNDTSVLDAKITKIDHLPAAQQRVLINRGVVGEYLEFTKFLKYAYLVDADGYHAAWRSLYLKLASNSVTLKMDSQREQWYFQDLTPWVHYVPLAANLSDVVEVYQWLSAHQPECQKIIAQAHNFISEMTFEREIDRMAKQCAEILALRVA